VSFRALILLASAGLAAGILCLTVVFARTITPTIAG